MSGEHRKKQLVDLRRAEPRLGYHHDPSLHPWTDDESLAANVRYLLDEVTDLGILHVNRLLLFPLHGGSRGRYRVDRRYQAEGGQ